MLVFFFFYGKERINMWTVIYYNISTWEHEWEEFETEKEAIEFAKKRLKIQREWEYLKEKVVLFRPESRIVL